MNFVSNLGKFEETEGKRRAIRGNDFPLRAGEPKTECILTRVRSVRHRSFAGPAALFRCLRHLAGSALAFTPTATYLHLLAPTCTYLRRKKWCTHRTQVHIAS